jgi:hypothetical protein
MLQLLRNIMKWVVCSSVVPVPVFRVVCGTGQFFCMPRFVYTFCARASDHHDIQLYINDAGALRCGCVALCLSSKKKMRAGTNARHGTVSSLPTTTTTPPHHSHTTPRGPGVVWCGVVWCARCPACMRAACLPACVWHGMAWHAHMCAPRFKGQGGRAGQGREGDTS